jgi:TPR repeat protein
MNNSITEERRCIDMQTEDKTTANESKEKVFAIKALVHIFGYPKTILILVLLAAIAISGPVRYLLEIVQNLYTGEINEEVPYAFTLLLPLFTVGILFIVALWLKNTIRKRRQKRSIKKMKYDNKRPRIARFLSVITILTVLGTIIYAGISYNWFEGLFGGQYDYINTEDDSSMYSAIKKIDSPMFSIIEQYDLAVQYNKDQDYENAYYWYKRAAESEHACAMYMLGRYYSAGYWVEQDYTKAVSWFSKAAEKGHMWAQYEIGDRYFYGEGVLQDFAQAVSWYRKASEQGNCCARYSLAYCYFNGLGVLQNQNLAIDLWTKLSIEGYSSARLVLEKVGALESYIDIEAIGNINVQETSRQNISNQAKILSFNEASTTSARGISISCQPKRVTWINFYPIFRTSINPSSASNQYVMWCSSDNAIAEICESGILTGLSTGITFVTVTTIDGGYHSTGAVTYIPLHTDDSVGQNNRGVAYYNLNRYEEAVEWFRKAVEQGNATALFHLGVLYYYGRGVNQDIEQALIWLMSAAQQGSDNASKMLEEIT